MIAELVEWALALLMLPVALWVIGFIVYAPWWTFCRLRALFKTG